MVIYKCECGSRFVVADNSEITRKHKREWKARHRRSRDNPGHGYSRNVARRSEQ